MKAIGLVSGGLDSSIAVALVRSWGIEVIALHFVSPFFGRKSFLPKVMEKLGAEFREVPVGEEYLNIVKNPRFGYGKNLNPCIDCKIFMLQKAKVVMEDEGASFVFTGEVVGQRPKSQMRNTLRLIEKESGLAGLLLRPLSAKLLPPTIPEIEGWVKREELLGIAGRGRKAQFELAKRFGIEEYSSPAGGCLLTDPLFCERLRDLMEYGPFTLAEIELLKFGRHFRFHPGYKLIVGRDAKENKVLLSLARPKDVLFSPQGGKGPLGVGRGMATPEDVYLSAQIIAYYTKNGAKKTPVLVREYGGTPEILEVPKCDEETLVRLRIPKG
ncbi:MAG: tRNA 4-thiouridine(8) synthase ThiI [Candidatus Caldatribacterium sp.]|uniref:tRNA 4-thiouridine(8) synthase ThiI n=1 Tax=Candidatus Caldatribacterium sp. TaxID=2282143 RepID=UPI002999DF44|nr:tRNA 4-thiouridine(8) synthase ThiI [Candidatus Caldatribacterium sp.]MCX7729775.1 tRNA 4-thiouridine(8) synthase ThiI [Candidatus Caldatribacterium sp.]MDW8081901.1 tRNA 4-thiouridine(8) synthase ThiI [Candidatus Calescibacterium sp.]